MSILPANSTEVRQAIYALAKVEEPPRSGWLAELILSDMFKATCMFVICCNVATASWALNFEIQNEGREIWWMNLVETVFVSFYACEVFLKLLVHRAFFFFNVEFSWNMFDFLLVILGVIDLVMQSLGLNFDQNLTSARVARVVKLARIVRVIRTFRIVGPLRIMVASIMQGLFTIFWALVILMIIWWTVSLILIQGFTTLIKEQSFAAEQHADVLFLFGSVPKAVYTIFSISFGGDDWGPYFELVASTGHLYAGVFIVYTFFFHIYLLNILTAIVVDHVVGLGVLDEKERVARFRQRKAQIVKQLSSLFRRIDVDGSGDITQAEFNDAMADQNILSLMEENLIELRDAKVLFTLLRNASSDEGVDARQFIDGLMSMQGAAQGIDMQILLYQANRLMKNVREQHGCAMKALGQVTLLVEKSNPGWLTDRHQAPLQTPPARPEAPEPRQELVSVQPAADAVAKRCL